MDQEQHLEKKILTSDFRCPPNVKFLSEFLGLLTV